MKSIELKIAVKVYESEKELSEEDAMLFEAAKSSTNNAYAPYSGFFVGAAILLEDGHIITGTNQENAAYPSGICAERVAMFYTGSNYPGVAPKTIFVTARSRDFIISEPIPPCGACRQALLEYETRYNSNIRVLLSGEKGRIYELESVKSLLPLQFSASDLRKREE